MLRPLALSLALLHAGPSLAQQPIPLMGGLDLPRLGYDVTEHVPTESATHVVFSKRSGGSQ